MLQSLEKAGASEDGDRVGGERKPVVAARLGRMPASHEARQSKLSVAKTQALREVHGSREPGSGF